MAVEARHPNLFHPQLLGNREIMNPIDGNANLYNTQMGYATPFLGTAAADTVLPLYDSGMNNSVPHKHAMKSDSTITYNVPASRKRSRDSITPFIATSYLTSQLQKNAASTFSLLGEDVSCFFQNQQFEMERLISQHMESVKLQLEEKRNGQTRKILQVIEIGMLKRLKAKEEEIEKIGKLNWALEERVKSLCIENQIWRDLAQSNEAKANALRINLEQVLAQAQLKDERIRGTALDEAELDDARSCCGSSGNEEREYEVVGGQRMLAREEGARTWVEDKGDEVRGTATNRWCKNCGREESCVLLLPCRHLCLCTTCGCNVHVCPVCKSAKNVSVHVNMC